MLGVEQDLSENLFVFVAPMVSLIQSLFSSFIKKYLKNRFLMKPANTTKKRLPDFWRHAIVHNICKRYKNHLA